MSNHWYEELLNPQQLEEYETVRAEKGLVALHLGGQSNGTVEWIRKIVNGMGMAFHGDMIGWRAIEHLCLDGDDTVIKDMLDIQGIHSRLHGHPAGGRPSALFDEYVAKSLDAKVSMAEDLIRILCDMGVDDYSLLEMIFAISGWGAMASIIIGSSLEQQKSWANKLHLAIIPSVNEKRGHAINWWLDTWLDRIKNQKVIFQSVDATTLAGRVIQGPLYMIKDNLETSKRVAEGSILNLLARTKRIGIDFTDVDAEIGFWNGVLTDALINKGLSGYGKGSVKRYDVPDIVNELGEYNSLSLFKANDINRMSLEEMIAGTSSLFLKAESIEKVTLIIPSGYDEHLIRPVDEVEVKILRSEGLNRFGLCLAVNTLSESAIDCVRTLAEC